MFRRPSPLFNIATDAGQAGGGSPAPDAAPETPTPAPVPVPAASKPAGTIDKAITMFRDKGALANEISTLKADNGRLTAELSTLRAQLTTVTAERDNLQAGFNRLEAALAASNAENKDVANEVTHQLASAGVPASGLPKGTPPVQTTATGDDRIAEINQQIEASTDAKEKGRLANEAWDLMMKRGGSVKVSAK